MLTVSIRRFIVDPASGDLDSLLRQAAAHDDGAADATLCRAAVDTSLASAGVTAGGRHPVLALASESESRLVDELVNRHGNTSSLRPIQPRGVDPALSRSWLAARQRDRSPALIVGPVKGLAGLLAPIERRGLRFRLAAGSAALALRPAAGAPDGSLRDRLTERLGLMPERLWQAWQPAGVATPFLSAWEDDGRFTIPHWTSVAIGAAGEIAITDLANAPGELRVETTARGRLADDARSFVLL